MAGTPEQQQGYCASKKDREKNFTSETCVGGGSAVQPCPGLDKFKIVELVEVFTHQGKEQTRSWQARKQYIHCDGRLEPDTAHPDYGRCIRLKARVEWIAGSKSMLLNGRPVSWSCQAGKTNIANLSGADKEGFGQRGGAATMTTPTDGKGWTPVVEFHLSDPVDQWTSRIPAHTVPSGANRKRRLSLYDGDTFTVIATDENKVSLNTGLLTVTGLIDWLPGMDQMPDTQISALQSLRSIPEGIVLHSGDVRPGVAEYLQSNPLSAHFSWSSGYDAMVQQVPLDLRASHAGVAGNHWWGYEWPGPFSENPRPQNQWNEFRRILGRGTGLLHLASGGHLKYFCFHSDIEAKKTDPGPGVTTQAVEQMTGLTWSTP